MQIRKNDDVSTELGGNKEKDDVVVDLDLSEEGDVELVPNRKNKESAVEFGLQYGK